MNRPPLGLALTSARHLAPVRLLWLALFLSCVFDGTSLPAATQADRAWETQVVAGTGQPEHNGDSGAAEEFNVGDPFGVEIGPDGALYICEVRNHRILRLDRDSGQISTFAGTGERGYTGDGGDARQAALNEPYELRFDRDGNCYVVEMRNHLVRRIDHRSRVIETIAGTGEPGFGGDGGDARNAQLHRPHSIALDDQGGLYIADIGNHRIRRVDLQTQRIETIGGNGGKVLPKPGQVARGNPLLGPRALFFHDSTLWIALREGHSVWKLPLASGKLELISGTGKSGPAVPAATLQEATFNGPKGIAVGPDQAIYVVDTENHAIRHIDLKTQQVTTVKLQRLEIDTAAKHQFGETENSSSSFQLARPHGIGIDADGNLFIGDTEKHRVLRAAPYSNQRVLR